MKNNNEMKTATSRWERYTNGITRDYLWIASDPTVFTLSFPFQASPLFGGRSLTFQLLSSLLVCSHFCGHFTSVTSILLSA